MPPLPLVQIEELDVPWLSSALDADVRSLRVERIGVGEGFASRLYRVHPEYAPGSSGPASLILKLLTDNVELLRVMNPQVAYRETRFYRELVRVVGHPTPHIYFADFDSARGCFTIVMEDLGGIRFGFDATPAESEAAMRALAKIHARFWRHAMLDEPWLAPVVRTDLDLPLLVARAIEAAERSGFGASHLSRAMRVLQPMVQRLAFDVDAAPKIHAHALCHGDFHRNNSVLQPDGRFVIYDWQMLEAGNPLRDVGYWMLTSLPVHERRAQQKMLLRIYRDALFAEGVRDYAAFQLAQDFRNGMLENLLKVYCIPALIEADADLLLLLRERVEAMSEDMHTIAVAHLLKAFVGARDWWQRVAA